VREVACQFGPDRLLAGIATEPAARTRSNSVVLVSAGVTPKFGPFRLYTELSRRLAELGFLTLRFDLGGIGDSGPAFEGRPLVERTRLQIGAALDFLRDHYGASEAVLSGLCSGGDDSFRHAEQDSRVTGVVMIDPFAYRTLGFRWRHFKHRAERKLLKTLGLFEPAPRRNAPALVNYEHLPQQQTRRILGRLVQRGVSLHFIYTAGMHEYFNHRGQLRSMFSGVDFGDRVKLDYLPHLDHTQLVEADRRALIDVIARGLTR